MNNQQTLRTRQGGTIAVHGIIIGLGQGGFRFRPEGPGFCRAKDRIEAFPIQVARLNLVAETAQRRRRGFSDGVAEAPGPRMGQNGQNAHTP